MIGQESGPAVTHEVRLRLAEARSGWDHATLQRIDAERRWRRAQNGRWTLAASSLSAGVAAGWWLARLTGAAK
jgi:hypothetical protein